MKSKLSLLFFMGIFLSQTFPQEISFDHFSDITDLHSINYLKNNDSRISNFFDYKKSGNNRSLDITKLCERVDSIITYDIADNYADKIYIVYDNSGNIISYTQEDWDNNIKVWTGISEFKYNSSGKIISKTLKYNIGDEWKNGSKQDFTFNKDGQLTSVLLQSWENGSWVNDNNRKITYDFYGNESEILRQSWFEDRWVADYREKYNYLDSSKISSYYYELFESNEWKIISHYEYSYDSYGNMVLFFKEHFDQYDNYFSERKTYSYDDYNRVSFLLWETLVSGEFVKSFLFSFSYNESSNNTVGKIDKWEYDHWVNLYLREYNYNIMGKLILELHKKWENEEWINFYQRTNVFDQFGNKTYEKAENWTGDKWDKYVSTTYIFDDNQRLIKNIEEKWINGIPTSGFAQSLHYNFMGNIISSSFELYNGNNWIAWWSYYEVQVSPEIIIPINAHRIDIFYNLLTGIERNNSTLSTQYRLYQNYPNPFNLTTTIKYSVPPLLGGAWGGLVTLKIFDTLGREIQTLVNKIQQPGTYKIEFNGKELPSGIYIYKLTAGAKSLSRKMLLLK